ncbi:MAG: hypothetical protein AB7K64_05990 [Variibacter sp.]
MNGIISSAMALPLWLILVALALLAIAIVLAAFRASRIETMVGAALLLLGAGGIALWTEHQAASRRLAVEERLYALQARAQAPGSVLACVDDSAGEEVDAACERNIYASPEAVAAATSFTASRFALLADAARYVGRGDARFDALAKALRVNVERDRFGLLANLLAVRENCTAERCDWLAVLHNPAAVQQNLQKQTFQANLARYASGWTQQQVAHETTGAAPDATANAKPAPAKATPLPSDYVLPSSDSIPPVSIMTNEPTATAPRPAATLNAPATDTKPQAAPLRPAKRPTRASERTNSSNAPLALTPPSPPE